MSQNEASQYWFGEIESFNSFHWHGETFSLPPNAVHILASPHCQNQAYAIGKHLAFQTHIEVTAEMVQSWCDIGEDELAEASASALDLYKGVKSGRLLNHPHPDRAKIEVNKIICFILDSPAQFL